jgi:hypothetical protein
LITEWGLEGAKGNDFPGVKVDSNYDYGEEVDMDPKAATRYRRSAARINYMAMERPDIGHSSKEISKSMSSPKVRDEAKIIRLIKYLINFPRLMCYYPWQDKVEEAALYTDSDWANDIKTRRSTSGGAIFLGGHLILHWSRVQNSIALSSGEAELNSAVKGISEVVGMVNTMAELGFEWGIKHFIDASATKGILNRTGNGKVKHLTVRQLWIQEAVERMGIKVVKIPRALNCADL